MTNPIEEAVARAIRDDVFGAGRYDTVTEQMRNEFRLRARAAIAAHMAALTEAGWVVVPRVPTEAMFRAGGTAEPFGRPMETWKPGEIVASTVWRAMIEASPPIIVCPPGEGSNTDTSQDKSEGEP